MFNILLLSFLLLATAGIDEKSAASLVDRDRIIEGILSRGSASSAWGAYYAGKFGLAECVPALFELVGRENKRAPGPVPVVKKAALDALIGLDAEVPVEFLSAGLHEDYLAETLILLARNADENQDALLGLMDHGPVDGQHWWAAAALLAPLEPPGLAQRLLPEIRFRLSVTVRDPNSAILIETFEYHGSGFWSSTSNLFPPKPTYIFSAEPEKGATVLRAKPIAVYFQRTEGARGGKSDCKVGPLTRAEHSLRVIEAMIGTIPDGLSPDAKCAIAVDWVDEQDFQERVDSQCSLLRADYSWLVEILCKRNLLFDADGTPKPEIEVKVHDRRKTKTPPLPELSVRE